MIGGGELQDRRQIVAARVLHGSGTPEAHVAVAASAALLVSGTLPRPSVDISLRRVADRVAFGLALLVGILAIWEFAAFAQSPWAREWAFGNGDLNGYLDGARRFLENGSPYLPEQRASSWTPTGHMFIHPPIALILFVPFLWLPAPAWWAVPLGVTAVLVVRARPSPWQWLAIALCLAWPRSVGSILAGNSDLWAMMGVALGLRFGWPFALLWVKPTFALFAFLRPRSLGWAAVLGLVASVPLLASWLDYATIMANARVGLDYSLLNLPLVMVPVIALAGRPAERVRTAVVRRRPFGALRSALDGVPAGPVGAAEAEATAA